ncbi:hypothetical protein KRR26_28235 [Corallococcus sp. M34]|uniref:hypothetical protein n=1 Tax=Citreicoccus inhibens TaxID=2849499 RepID=UPI001C248AE0|nr:hypothetical protein [Citreicoccus inhibens]MBU8899511.1 hypothetical protein [Citreicoccus inhibens]
MRSLLLVSCCALLSLALGCHSRPRLVPVSSPPPPLRLDFRPPVDRVLTELLQTSRTVERGGARTRDDAELTTQSRFAPSEGGWLLTQTVEHARRVHDGQEVTSAVDELLTRFALQQRLSADGSFIRLEGADAARQAVRQALPAGPEMALLERFFAPEALEARARREWEVKYGGLFQRNLVEGQRTWAVDAFTTGDSEGHFLLERTVQGSRATEYGDAVVFTLRCLDKVPKDASRELLEAWSEAGSPALTSGVTCQGEQVVARSRFVPVHRRLTVSAPVRGETWTWTTETHAQQLQEEAQ